MEPRVRTLAVVVKRWAQAAGVSGAARDGFISPFAWTLLAIYYLQVCHGLPSLHALAPNRPEGSSRWRSDPGHCDVAFVDAVEARRALGLQPEAMEGRPQPCRLGEAALLRGFFAFFANTFGWEDEVASVRLGLRSGIRSPHFASLRTVSRDPVPLNIENPVEVGRNLNGPLDCGRADELRQALLRAAAVLESGAGLAELLGSSAAPSSSSAPRPCVDLPESSTSCEGGFLELPDFVSDLRACTCDVCGRRFDGRLLLMQHQVERGHFNSCSTTELARLRDGDAAAVDAVAGRLRAALAGG
uniref:C2H2-type domain-containing protein n=1 Tax=Pyrodinium bahamense TaxID=73915 RepID=A0A7S0FWM9_9DINO